MKLVLKFCLWLRKGYSLFFEYFAMKRIMKHFSPGQIDQAKKDFDFFRATIHGISDYARAIKDYSWKSDKLKGLIDWSPSKKNIWQFFLDKEYSRDCDDFSALAYYIFKGLKNYRSVEEWCVLIDNKISEAHMITIVEGMFIFCNNNQKLVLKEGMKETMQKLYNSTIYCRYRS